MKNIGDFKWNIMRNEILNLLINRNSSYTHLYIHSEFDYQLYNNPGVKDCFLRLQHVSCGDNTKQHILEGLANESNWDELIDTLIQFSPINLYKFKFTSIKNLKLESLNFFLDNWEKRHSMLLQIVLKESLSMFMGSLGREQKQQQQQKNLLEEYKGKGIIKNYHFSGEFEDFEWIQKKYL
ncbi:unnamed protein product [Rhizophagus irregularis]|nr:unnamed protein product [Rhizophagus irregularis]